MCQELPGTLQGQEEGGRSEPGPWGAFSRSVWTEVPRPRAGHRGAGRGARSSWLWWLLLLRCARCPACHVCPSLVEGSNPLLTHLLGPRLLCTCDVAGPEQVHRQTDRQTDTVCALAELPVFEGGRQALNDKSSLTLSSYQVLKGNLGSDSCVQGGMA